MNPDDLTLKNVGRDPDRRPAGPAKSYVEAIREGLAAGLPVLLAIKEAAKKFPNSAREDLPPMPQVRQV